MGMAKDTEQANAMKEFMARPPNEAPEKKEFGSASRITSVLYSTYFSLFTLRKRL